MTARAGVIALALFTLAGLRAAPLVPVLGLLQRVAAATICVWLLAFTARLTSDL